MCVRERAVVNNFGPAGGWRRLIRKSVLPKVGKVVQVTRKLEDIEVVER